MLTYIREDEAGAHSLQAVREGLWHLGRIRPVGALSVVPTREQEWTDTWKAYYRVLRVGERVVIKPSWLEHEPAADDLVIDLDPGLAFGTGLHPTTRLCLRAIEQEMRPGRRALDLGSGSGILSVLLAKMGATEVVALDTDRVAVDATEATARRNGVERVIHAGWGSIEAADGEYDFVAANIVANVIIGLAAPIAAKLAPGGVLVVSGIIEDRYDEVALALAGERLRPRALLRETDWVAIVADRPTEEDEQH
ncbi:MAG: 50S ribosomal protein L11 methyltransferase [Chloroflexia bacterium]